VQPNLPSLDILTLFVLKCLEVLPNPTILYSIVLADATRLKEPIGFRAKMRGSTNLLRAREMKICLTRKSSASLVAFFYL
jgi:hypothetical protein